MVLRILQEITGAAYSQRKTQQSGVVLRRADLKSHNIVQRQAVPCRAAVSDLTVLSKAQTRMMMALLHHPVLWATSHLKVLSKVETRIMMALLHHPVLWATSHLTILSKVETRIMMALLHHPVLWATSHLTVLSKVETRIMMALLHHPVLCPANPASIELLRETAVGEKMKRIAAKGEA
jgi:hypothetical protein